MSGRGRIVETRATMPAASGTDAVAAVAALAMPIIQARQLFQALALLRPPLPDDHETARMWLAAIPPAAEMDAVIATLDHALTVPATREQAHALIAVLIDGIGKPATEATPTSIAAIATAACEPDELADIGDEWGPVSCEVIALATRKIWRENSKWSPAPSEFREACLAARQRVEILSDGLREIADEKIMLRIELQSLLGLPFDDVDDDAFA